jgi:ABC-type polysaccharide/polyol phosphate transport system ATPase subunit
VVLAQNVSKLYHLYRRPSDRILEFLPFSRRKRHQEFWALRDVNLSVQRGEILGIIGPNGSGKSTLLQVISGILPPTRGRVLTGGRVAALLELGAGFNPDFTGRENVRLNGEIMGLSRAEIDRVFPKIEEFAEIGAFMDRPVREYSSGMYVRLAFSTAIHVEPEILIVDEALSVGDAIFANRCMQKFEELRERKMTILFVSHDLGLVKRLSDRALLMLNGQVAAEGSPKDVVNRYVGIVHERRPVLAETADQRLGTGSFRHGDGSSRIIEVRILNTESQRTSVVRAGECVSVQIRALFHTRVQFPVVGLLIRNRLGIDVYGTNTRVEQHDLGIFEAGDEIDLCFRFECLLARGEYTLTVATQHADGSSQDWVDDVLDFTVVDSKDIAGIANLRASVEWQKRNGR